MSNTSLNVKKKILPYTSFVFLAPSYYAYTYDHTLISSVLFFLASTSVIYHSYHHPVTFWFDQVAIYLTVTSSFVYGYQGGFWVFLIPTVGNLWNTCIFWYGYKTKTLGFHKDFFISEVWHSTIHFVSAVSYAAVIYFISQPPALLGSSPG